MVVFIMIIGHLYKKIDGLTVKQRRIDSNNHKLNPQFIYNNKTKREFIFLMMFF
jgi:hypothetical protein